MWIVVLNNPFYLERRKQKLKKVKRFVIPQLVANSDTETVNLTSLNDFIRHSTISLLNLDFV